MLMNPLLINLYNIMLIMVIYNPVIFRDYAEGFIVEDMKIIKNLFVIY